MFFPYHHVPDPDKHSLFFIRILYGVQDVADLL